MSVLVRVCELVCLMRISVCACVYVCMCVVAGVCDVLDGKGESFCLGAN